MSRLFFGVSLCANGMREQTKAVNVLPNVPVKDAGYTLEKDHPYDAPVYGLVNGITTKTATYSVYVPQGQQPWRAGVLILVPNGMTAEAFAMSELGRKWMSVCDSYGCNMGIMEPKDGAWNIHWDATLRDDVQAVADVYTQMRSKSMDLPIPFTMDKSRFTLVG